MIAAFLTALCWSVSAMCSARTAGHLGGPAANRTRLFMATALMVAVMAAWEGLTGLVLPSAATPWFVLSGAVGLGLGDICLFCAYNRLGPRLSAILTHCLATPLGALAEWWWLGNALTAGEIACIAVILGGVALALWPDRREASHDAAPRRYVSGVIFGLGSAVGMAGAAVISRKGYHVEADYHWLDATVWRNAGGVAVTCLIWMAMRTVRQAQGTVSPRKDWRKAWPWLIGTAVLGPAVGVACYQLALQNLQAGQVQAVVALVPVMIIPMAWWLDGDRPSLRSVLGGIIGVTGVVWMALLHVY
jgi:drug/metabolite transporter (DMT)-like permease